MILRTILIWVAVGLVGTLLHRLITGEGLDNSSYFVGLMVAVISIVIEDEI